MWGEYKWRCVKKATQITFRGLKDKTDWSHLVKRVLTAREKYQELLNSILRFCGRDKK